MTFSIAEYHCCQILGMRRLVIFLGMILLVAGFEPITHAADSAGWATTEREASGWKPARRSLAASDAGSAEEAVTYYKTTVIEASPPIPAGANLRDQERPVSEVREQPGTLTVVTTSASDHDGDDPRQSVVPAVDQFPPPVPPAPLGHPSAGPDAPLPLPESDATLFYEPLEPPFVAYEQAQPLHEGNCECQDCQKFGPIKRFKFYSQLLSGDVGIGQERVAYAPFQIEQAQPYRNNRIRFDSAFGLTSPDRAEYFWAASGTGPAIPASEIDYFDFRYTTESANGPISIVTDIPIRALDYDNVRTAGLSNISIGTKTAIVQGDNWFVSSIFRMYLPFGSKSRGSSNGHISIEPGLLARYRINDRAYFHGQAKWWIPFGGNEDFNGQVLNYGGGISYVLYESDAFAALPTLEIDAWSVTSGLKTLPGGTVTSVGGDSFVNVLPGIRYVFGPAGELGLFEFGVMGGFSFGNEGWYDQILRAEMRWSF